MRMYAVISLPGSPAASLYEIIRKTAVQSIDPTGNKVADYAKKLDKDPSPGV